MSPTFKYTVSLVTDQPQASPDLGSLNVNQPISPEASAFDEKSIENSLENGHHERERERNCHCEHGNHPLSFSTHHRQSCYNVRLRELFLPVMICLLALGGLLALSCVNWHDWSSWGGDGLMRRALTDTTTTSTSTGSTFTHNKRV